MTENIPKILLIYTGGTIGMVKDFKTGALKALDFDKLIKHIPEINLLNCTIDNISFKNPIDSSDMGVNDWVFLADVIEENYEEFDGFVVLHGSDTMSYTSSALSFMLENLQKPVIFTGSQLPIGDLRTDAKENLITSIKVASAHRKGKPIISEVGLYFEYKLYRANRTTKINAEHFEAFASLNLPPLAESGVHLKFNHNLIEEPKKDLELKVQKKLDDRVFVLKMFPGITPLVVESIFQISDLKGVIIETYGSGNAPTKPWFIERVKKAIKKGIHIVNVTQCAGGNVIMGQYEASIALESIGVISGHDITTEAALAKMMCLLGKQIPNNQFKELFESSLRGEVTVESD